MGCRSGGFISEEENAVSESLSDAFLFTTLCIIGLAVDVHIRDGSVYSGTFHTACLDDDYAIVLKRARLIKKGNQKANVPDGCLIETLIIQAEDLVQVVAKDILLPAEGNPGKSWAIDDFVLAGGTSQKICQQREGNGIKPNESGTGTGCIETTSIPSIAGERLVGGSPEGNPSISAVKPKFQGPQEIDEVQACMLNVGVGEIALAKNNNQEAEVGKFSNRSFEKSAGIDTKDPNREKHSSNGNQQSRPLSSGVIDSRPEFGLRSSSTSSKLVPPTTAKEFKLNPKAKVFSPSSMLHRSAIPAVATLANMTYLPDSLPVVPIATSEPEIDRSSFASRSSAPTKHLPHNNLAYGSGRGDLYYSQPIVAHVGSRAQPVRYAAQNNHLQPGPAYMHPNSQNVMAGRLGPLVFVHPVSNDVAQSAGGLPQVSSRPLLAPYPVNLPKHQGTAAMQALQLYVTPPFMANGQQPLAVPGYIPMSQPLGPLLPVITPFPVTGPDSSLVTKFV